MNEFENPSLEQLDRFVDGELSDAERREILEQLDREECSESCGWRRLALTFVEAQALRQELRQFARTAAVEVSRPVQAARQHKVPGVTAVSRLASLALLCLVAFGLGRISIPSRFEIAQLSTTPAGRVTTNSAAKDVPKTLDVPEELIAGMNVSPEINQETLRLVFEDLEEGISRSVTVPVVDGTESDLAEYLAAPSSMPTSVREALLREGQVVHEDRQLYEVQLPDGRVGVVPVCDVTLVRAAPDLFQ